MFASIADTWTSVLTNPADIKEVSIIIVYCHHFLLLQLIPEFYCRSDFLRNTENLDLGILSTFERLNDVALPPWAKSFQSNILFID